MKSCKMQISIIKAIQFFLYVYYRNPSRQPNNPVSARRTPPIPKKNTRHIPSPNCIYKLR